MAAVRTINRRLRSVLWCVVVPLVVVAAYLGLGLAVLSVISEPVLATAVLGVGVLTAVGALRSLRPRWVTYQPSPRPSSEISRLGWHVAGGTVLAFLAGQALALWLYTRGGSAGFDQAAQARVDAGMAMTVLLTLVVAPAAEEMLLRGLVYPWLRRRAGIIAATLITSVMFAVMHGNAIQFVSVLPVAVLLALVYEQTRRVWPCVLIHLAFNLAAVVVPAQAVFVFASPVSALLLVSASGAYALMLYRKITGRSAPTGEPLASSCPGARAGRT